MAWIPSGKQSPRVVNGCLYWYAGDTFLLDVTLELRDQDGEPVPLAQSGSVTLEFSDASRAPVRQFTFTELTGSTVTLEMDETVTADFPSGDYFLSIRYTDAQRTTVLHGAHCHVE